MTAWLRSQYVRIPKKILTACEEKMVYEHPNQQSRLRSGRCRDLPKFRVSHWGNTPEVLGMLKQTFMGVAALTAIGLSAGSAWAQCGCCSIGVTTNGTTVESRDLPAVTTVAPSAVPTQSYQRFSYSPSTVATPTPQTIAAPSVVLAAPQVQSYRRFSYQPNAYGSSSISRKHPYEYSKADPRRYRP